MTNDKPKNSKDKTKKTEVQTKTMKELRNDKFYYSFLTIVLLFCLIQIGFSAILNITKVISHKTKIMALEKVLHEAQDHNKELKKEIQANSSAQNLEGIARNNLKMAAPNEIMIIINNPKADNKKKNKDAK